MTLERPPDIGAPLDCYFKDGSFKSYVAQEASGTVSRKELETGSAVIQTVSVQRNVDLIFGWVQRMEPFVLVGPEGAGKSMILNHIFSKSLALCLAFDVRL